jgi:hypothetical protein
MAWWRCPGASPAPVAAHAHVTATVIVAGRSTYTFAALQAASLPSSSATQMPAYGSWRR